MKYHTTHFICHRCNRFLRSTDNQPVGVVIKIDEQGIDHNQLWCARCVKKFNKEASHDS